MSPVSADEARASHSSEPKGPAMEAKPPPVSQHAGVDIGRVSALESVIYWGCWTFGCLYSTYRLYRVIQRHPDALDVYSAPGWIAGLSVDRCDDEFEVLIRGQLPVYAAFMTIHLVVSHFLRSLAMFKVLPLFHFLLSACYLCFSVGLRRYLLLLGAALLFFAVSRTRSRRLCWLLVVAALLTHGRLLLAAVGADVTTDDENRSYLVTAVQMWNLCRAAMFCCDQAERPPAMAHHDNLVSYLGFMFYGPVLAGPLLAHADYLDSLSAAATAGPGRPRLRRLLTTLLQLAGWLFVVELSNHLIHYHALRYSPEDVERLFGRWELAGLNYWAGQYFHVKYVVCYGIPCALAAFEGVRTPLQPRCVAWIASYSDMWKYFDHGLYRFMRRHIYGPLTGERPSTLRRTLASVFVFAFVFLWHGLMPHLLVWSAANFLCISLERLGEHVAASRRCREWRRVVGPGLRRRCHGLLAAPLFLVSLVSQVGFLTNSGPLGWLAIGEGLAPATSTDMLVTLGFMYCGCQVSYDVKRWRQLRARLPREQDKLKQL